MGSWFQIIVDRDVSEADAPLLAERMRGWLSERGVIGATTQGWSEGPSFRPGPAYEETLKEPQPDVLDTPHGFFTLKVGKRLVFSSPDGEVTCRACGSTVDLGTHGDAWVEAVGRWYEGDDSVPFPCPKCGRPEQLTEWAGEWPWGFGNLGLEFWDWTPLSERFVSELTAQLGHRTVLVRGKL
jgi:hypothetical protein